MNNTLKVVAGSAAQAGWTWDGWYLGQGGVSLPAGVELTFGPLPWVPIRPVGRHPRGFSIAFTFAGRFSRNPTRLDVGPVVPVVPRRSSHRRNAHEGGVEGGADTRI